jgi:hypothetical protein
VRHASCGSVCLLLDAARRSPLLAVGRRPLLSTAANPERPGLGAVDLGPRSKSPAGRSRLGREGAPGAVAANWQCLAEKTPSPSFGGVLAAVTGRGKLAARVG